MPYGPRMWCIAVLMSAAYTMVAFGRTRGWQLLGVVFSALQGGLGEASCLAMCTFFDSRSAITFWASGTGFAGKGSALHRVAYQIRLRLAHRGLCIRRTFKQFVSKLVISARAEEGLLSLGTAAAV